MRYYRVIIINKETQERQMLIETFKSKKKAIETATRFCLTIKNADFEIKAI